MKVLVYRGPGKRALEDKPRSSLEEPSKCVAKQSHQDNNEVSVEETKVVVGEYENEIDAEIAKGHLKASGIVASIIKDDGGGMFPSLQNSEGVQLVVSESHGERAKKILQSQIL
jgi:hypothetical protein